jgi:hypothetical protein
MNLALIKPAWIGQWHLQTFSPMIYSALGDPFQPFQFSTQHLFVSTRYQAPVRWSFGDTDGVDLTYLFTSGLVPEYGLLLRTVSLQSSCPLVFVQVQIIDLRIFAASASSASQFRARYQALTSTVTTHDLTVQSQLILHWQKGALLSLITSCNQDYVKTLLKGIRATGLTDSRITGWFTPGTHHDFASPSGEPVRVP